MPVGMYIKVAFSLGADREHVQNCPSQVYPHALSAIVQADIRQDEQFLAHAGYTL